MTLGTYKYYANNLEKCVYYLVSTKKLLEGKDLKLSKKFPLLAWPVGYPNPHTCLT